MAGQKQLRRSEFFWWVAAPWGRCRRDPDARRIGRLTIADRDYVDESNLQAPVLYCEADCRDGLPKAVAAARRLQQINSQVELVEKVLDVNARSIESWFAELAHTDGTDNFETRFLINDASIRGRFPDLWRLCCSLRPVSGLVPGKTPCLRCVLGQLPDPGSAPTCDTSGVIAPIVHWVAALQAAEAMKVLTGNSEQLSRKLVTMDLWGNRFSSVDLSGLQRNGECSACGQRRFELLQGEYEGQAQALCGRNAVQIWRISTRHLTEPIAEPLPSFALSVITIPLRANLEGLNRPLQRWSRALSEDTDVEEARRIYARLSAVRNEAIPMAKTLCS